MNKIILLGWDGPISNSRTWRMPGLVDPVAIQLLNDLTVAGWKTILTSTVRKNFRSENPKSEATEFMLRAGFYVQWYGPLWRTDPDYTSLRHLEVARMMHYQEFPDDDVFLVIDDEKFPDEFLDQGLMVQIKAQSHSGIDYLGLSKAYKIACLNDQELEVEFSAPEDDDDWGEDA